MRRLISSCAAVSLRPSAMPRMLLAAALAYRTVLSSAIITPSGSSSASCCKPSGSRCRASVNDRVARRRQHSRASVPQSAIAMAITLFPCQLEKSPAITSKASRAIASKPASACNQNVPARRRRDATDTEGTEVAGSARMLGGGFGQASPKFNGLCTWRATKCSILPSWCRYRMGTRFVGLGDRTRGSRRHS